MVCPNCNAEIKEGTRFCEYCGTAIQYQQPPVQPQQMQYQQPPVQPQQMQHQQPPVQPPHGNRSRSRSRVAVSRSTVPQKGQKRVRSNAKKKPTKEDVFWNAIGLLVGLVGLLVAFFICGRYYFADVKFKAEAELIDVKSTIKYKLKSDYEVERLDEAKKAGNYVVESDYYKEYYEYSLRWRFFDPHLKEERTFSETKESDYEDEYKRGDTETVRVYYTKGGDDYEFFGFFHVAVAGVFILIGGLFVFFSTGGLIRTGIRYLNYKTGGIS